MTTSRFDWLLYRGVADHLFMHSGDHSMRSVISRAYYAAFASARDRLAGKRRWTFSTERSVHRQVIKALTGSLSRKERDRALAKLGWDLDRLRIERNQADYETNQSFSKGRAGMALNLAKSIAGELPRI